MPAEVETRTAAEIGGVAELGGQAKALLHQHTAPENYVAALCDAGLAGDALSFIAHWLSKRDGVWWGCLCVWHAGRARLSAAEETAVQAVVRWVREPSEARRQALQPAGDQAGGMKSAAGALAYAASFSGGSVMPPDMPIIPPPPTLTADTIARLLPLAAVSWEPERADALYRHFVVLGLEVAAGTNRFQ